jgi:hypothetical protein
MKWTARKVAADDRAINSAYLIDPSFGARFTSILRVERCGELPSSG